MRKQTIIVTEDGNHFETEERAIKYLDKKYGDRLSLICHKILAIGKYAELLKFLDENLYTFEELIDSKRELESGVIDEDED
jgi:hypothetical protein